MFERIPRYDIYRVPHPWFRKTILDMRPRVHVAFVAQLGLCFNFPEGVVSLNCPTPINCG